jgi:hypothetical protein
VEKGIFQADAGGHHNQNMMLLVITKESCGPDAFNLQSIVNQSADSLAQVTLLVHSLKNVNEALMDNSRFFHEVLRSDQLIYQNDRVSGLIEYWL